VVVKHVIEARSHVQPILARHGKTQHEDANSYQKGIEDQ
jgi:hypothetical protein